MDTGTGKETLEKVIMLQTLIPRIEKYIADNYSEAIYFEEACLEVVADICHIAAEMTVQDEEFNDEEISAENYPAKKYKKEARKKELGLASRRLEDVIGETEETFSQSLLRMITQKDLKDSDVYNRANISRQLFSKIRKDIDYQPTKKTVFALIIAMKLNIDEAKDLLEKAGFSFSPSKKEDFVVQYFIEEENYDIFLLNEVLEHFKLPTLF
ncbi:MAG: hypothetical protein Q4D07_06920 [Selenomonadaceae bacterium]|nr:hypothetical protein [Selenomonadaceae bacterium]